MLAPKHVDMCDRPPGRYYSINNNLHDWRYVCLILAPFNFTGATVRNKYATTRKTAPSDAVRRIMTDKLQLEYEFYFFVKRRFEQYYANMKTNLTSRHTTQTPT